MDPSEYQPGDLVFCCGKGLVARTIRLVQSWRSPQPDAHWNHVAILSHPAPLSGDWWVVQAEGKGVVKAKLSTVSPGGVYTVVKCPATADPERVVDFAHSQLGVKYGFLTIASIIFNVITPQRLALRKPGTWICSALAAGSLWYAGWPVSEVWHDLYQVTPADLYGRVA